MRQYSFTSAQWTRPYYGITHLETDTHLCTVASFASFSEAVMYRKPVRIADGRQQLFCEPAHIEAAKHWCEHQLRS